MNTKCAAKLRTYSLKIEFFLRKLMRQVELKVFKIKRIPSRCLNFFISKLLQYLQKKFPRTPRKGGASFAWYRRISRRICAVLVLRMRKKIKLQEIEIARKLEELSKSFKGEMNLGPDPHPGN